MKETVVIVVASLTDAGLCVQTPTVNTFGLPHHERVRDAVQDLAAGERVLLITDWAGLERAQRVGAALADFGQLWIVGKMIDWKVSAWEFQGVFGTEAAAVDACVDADHFVGPAVLNVRQPVRGIAWGGAYYPMRPEGAGAALAPPTTAEEWIGEKTRCA